MKHPVQYLFSVLLTLLLIAAMIASAASVVFRTKAADPKTCLSLVDSQELVPKVQSELNAYFKAQENTTGIPAETYAKALTAERIDSMVRSSIENGFRYLSGLDQKLEPKGEFAEMEADVTAFFENYAASENIEMNESYETALQSSIESAEKAILTECDVFRISSLDDAGLIGTVRKVMPWTVWLIPAALLIVAVLMVILFAINAKEWEHGIYWTASAMTVSALLMLVPSVWLQQTRWFDRFAVKTDHVFSAVTGYLYTLTHSVITVSVCMLITAVLLYVLFGVIHGKRRQKNTIKKAKH